MSCTNLVVKHTLVLRHRHSKCQPPVVRCASHVPLSGTTGTPAAAFTASSSLFIRPVTAAVLLILRLLSLVLLLLLMSMAFALAFAGGVLTFALAAVSLLGPRGMATLTGAGAAFAV